VAGPSGPVGPAGPEPREYATKEDVVEMLVGLEKATYARGMTIAELAGRMETSKLFKVPHMQSQVDGVIAWLKRDPTILKVVYQEPPRLDKEAVGHVITMVGMELAMQKKGAMLIV
jgi:hypothetical protein